jgi:predicted dehydrogenase
MIRYGIVGFGLHAVKRMMPGFNRSTNSRVTALSRRDMKKASESARQHNIPLAFDSAEALCRSSEVDAVFVTTPNSLHLPDVLTAISCGKPVLCEKPLAMNADECRQMVEAARKAKVQFGVAHVFRFEESTAQLRDWIAAGKIGKPIFARSEFSFPGAPGHARKWLYDPKIAGGGPVADVGVHCIDTLRFVLQDEVVRVSARGMFDKDSGELEAAAVLTLEFSQGTLASVLVSYRAEYRSPLEFVGTTGVLRADDGLNVEHPIELEIRREGKVIKTKTVFNELAYARMLDAFSDAVEGRSKFPASGEIGWQNQEILDAAYRSIKSGKTEDVRSI